MIMIESFTIICYNIFARYSFLFNTPKDAILGNLVFFSIFILHFSLYLILFFGIITKTMIRPPRLSHKMD